jgi:hypothetical protein
MADSDALTKKDLIDLEARHEAKFDAKLDAKFDAVVDRLTELIRDVETKLLTSFHGYGKGQALRMHDLEVSDAAVKGRLEAIEERVLNLETRRSH